MNDAPVIGARIRELRNQTSMSLTELATRAGVSKSYLSTVENGTGSRPGVAILHKLATALGVTLGDLLGRSVQANEQQAVPESLRVFATQTDLPEADIAMLAGIKFRGEAPRTPERWKFIYDAIVMSGKAEGNQR
ncbi:helix-turn-helix transcriptional regulator [Knoellia sp. S7-12]|uniref:helix-turn-helix domain-containing protein n=1 Tax=Knoellia sp. S7-12 TaxID=3126698 RepID=UPI003369A7EC